MNWWDFVNVFFLDLRIHFSFFIKALVQFFDDWISF